MARSAEATRCRFAEQSAKQDDTEALPQGGEDSVTALLSDARRGLAKDLRVARHVEARLDHHGAYVMRLDVVLQSIRRKEARLQSVIDLLQQNN